MRKIETKEELIDHLIRVSSAYRKSYKFYGIINRLLQIGYIDKKEHKTLYNKLI